MELENRHGAGNKKESRIIYSHTSTSSTQIPVSPDPHNLGIIQLFNFDTQCMPSETLLLILISEEFEHLSSCFLSHFGPPFQIIAHLHLLPHIFLFGFPL